MMRTKSTQRRWPDRRKRQSRRPSRRLKKMVALRRPTRSITTKSSRRDRPNSEELQLPQRRRLSTLKV